MANQFKWTKWEILQYLLGTRNFIDLNTVERNDLEAEVDRMYDKYHNRESVKEEFQSDPQLLTETGTSKDFYGFAEKFFGLDK